jgi:DNA-binding NarL/FixJ family response regulator
VGYLLKDRVAQVGEFLDALDRIGAGGAAFDPEVVRQLLAHGNHADPLARLTPRERDVLDAMAEGLTNAGISERLRMSVSAVEKHVTSIFGKLGIPETAGYSRRVLAVLRYLGS